MTGSARSNTRNRGRENRRSQRGKHLLESVRVKSMPARLLLDRAKINSFGSWAPIRSLGSWNNGGELWIDESTQC